MAGRVGAASMSSRAPLALVTGSSGLIGSEAVAFLDARGWRVHGVDNNMRRDFFGARRRHDLEPRAPARA